MSLTYDTPAGKLVYDATTAGDPRIAYNGPHRRTDSSGGFGSVTTRRMLEHDRPAKHPWLTVDVAQQELAIIEHQREMREGWDN
jgi:hypothetical protein